MCLIHKRKKLLINIYLKLKFKFVIFILSSLSFLEIIHFDGWVSIVVIFIIIVIIINLFQFGLKKQYKVKKHYD